MPEKSLNELAVELNDVLSRDNCIVPGLLSARGTRAFFPRRGILGQSAEARGMEINATIGTAFEDDGSPLCLDCVKEMLNIPATSFLYAPSFGLRSLREKWGEKLREKNPGLEGQRFSLPVVTNALTHALFVAGSLFLDKGDKLILPDLYWDNYELLFQDGCGASFQTFPTFRGSKFNVAGLEKRLMAKGDKKVILLNFPNNPTGYTPTESEAYAIRDAVLKAAEAGKKIVAILDDAYFGLVYEKGVFGESVFSLLASLHRNVLAVKLDGPTKEDYVWGFRVGFITFAMKGLSDAQLAALEDKAAGLVRGTISSSSNIAQTILCNAYKSAGYPEQRSEKFSTLRQRYREIRAILRKHKEYRDSFTAMPFNSGYFMCVKLRGADPEKTRKLLLEKYSTGTIMLSGLLRLAYSSVPTEKLEKLFANIHSAVCEIKESACEC